MLLLQKGDCKNSPSRDICRADKARRSSMSLLSVKYLQDVTVPPKSKCSGDLMSLSEHLIVETNHSTMRFTLFPIAATFLFCSTCIAQPVTLYPGDTNNDGVANHFDLLPIGVAYGMEGIPRPGATFDWAPQLLFPPWPDALPVSGINKGFVDCDGNGFIDTFDLSAIVLNFDSIQNNAQPLPAAYPPKLIDTCLSCAKPDISITYSRDTLFTEEGGFDTLYAYIVLRYPPNVPPPAGALGIAFDVAYNYDPDKIVDALTEVYPDTFPDTRMYVIATSTAAQLWRLPAPGRMGFAAAGRGANVFFISDTLFVAKFIIDDMIIRGEEQFSINISNVLLVNNLEQIVCFGEVKQAPVLIISPVSEPELRGFDVHLSPNPVRDILVIESPDALMEKVEIHSLTGACVFATTAGSNHRFELPVVELPSGVWVAVVYTQQGINAKKFVKYP